MSLYERLLRDIDPSDDFIVTPSAVYSYGEALDRSHRFAAVLRERGAGPDTRVMVQVDKSPEAVALYLAVLQVGAIYVPLNTAYTAREVEYFASDAEPVAFVATPGNVDELRHVMPDTTHLLSLGVDCDGTLAEEAAGAGPDQRADPRSGDQVAAMLYTSGTTGRSKGAMLTSTNLLSNVEALYSAWGWRPDDVLLHVLPIFHTHGLFVALNLAMMGGSVVRFHGRFDVDATLGDLPRSTVMMGVPTFYHRLLSDDRIDGVDLARMRLFTSGSAPLSAHVHREFEERTGHRILERYGMTETGMLFSNPLDGDRVAGTVGFTLPGVDGRVVDDTDSPCKTDESGLVQVRGDNVFTGYWRMPDKTAAEFTGDGWFRTGDIGRMDSEGRLTLAGRASDMIISGGLNVYPKEIELVLDGHAGVAESAVIGVGHPDLGEAVVAAIVPATPDLEVTSLGELCKRDLAGFKRPKHFVLVEALPRNAMGNVQKAALRDRFAGLLS